MEVSTPRSILGLQISLRGPQELLKTFWSRLAANAYVGHWNLFTSHIVSVPLFYAPYPSISVVCAHLSATRCHRRAAFALRLRLCGSGASLTYYSEPIFRPNVGLAVEYFELPPSLLVDPFLKLTRAIKIPLSFPSGPASCSSCFQLGHPARACPTRSIPPCDRQCGLC